MTRPLKGLNSCVCLLNKTLYHNSVCILFAAKGLLILMTISSVVTRLAQSKVIIWNEYILIPISVLLYMYLFGFIHEMRRCTAFDRLRQRSLLWRRPNFKAKLRRTAKAQLGPKQLSMSILYDVNSFSIFVVYKGDHSGYANCGTNWKVHPGATLGNMFFVIFVVETLRQDFNWLLHIFDDKARPSASDRGDILRA